ncbi:hypothetical protein D3C80_1786410 [compost metagenome]
MLQYVRRCLLDAEAQNILRQFRYSLQGCIAFYFESNLRRTQHFAGLSQLFRHRYSTHFRHQFPHLAQRGAGGTLYLPRLSLRTFRILGGQLFDKLTLQRNQ